VTIVALTESEVIVGTLGGVAAAGLVPEGVNAAPTMNQLVDVLSCMEGACGPAALESTSSEPSVPSDTWVRNVAATPSLEPAVSDPGGMPAWTAP
jgi:hypothetical protein